MTWQMKRNMDLVRQILLEIEKQPFIPGYPIDLNIPGFSHEVLSYHVMIMHEAGLIEAAPELHNTGHPPHWSPNRLTWQGHEFIDAARDNTIWNRAMATVKDKMGSIPFTLLQQLLIQLGAASLGLN
ncbi:MAG: DUF2513 domain-containing protein [Anaerolineae bacterium]|nr:DUF2513 domain-containing protein [Anaerolineae bacterium]